jgi:hypothetical protein
MAMLEIYKNEEYRNKILDILDSKLRKNKRYTGRPGMNLWQIFVLGQFRLGLNLSYDELEDFVNCHELIRSLLGIHRVGHFELPKIEITYQNILDNVGLLTDDMVRELNEVIIEYSNKEVFKKKEEEACTLKTDSYVVKSNVHFPTDYNLLWDCARKSLDMVSKIVKDEPGGTGWRKLKDWRKRIKNGARQVGLISSKGGANKAERLEQSVDYYLEVTKALVEKIESFITTIDLGTDDMRWLYIIQLEEYVRLTKKHIDLLERRILKGETIDHKEKMFSIFEQYTEWINKGKPFVELGKKLCITTNKEGLIVDYRIMENEADSEVVIDIAADVLKNMKVKSWSFDKGFYSKINKELLEGEVGLVVMPKKGKQTKAEKAEESQKEFKRLRNEHSAVESNINELEHRGLDRCPDRGYAHFKRYIGLGICAYNLHKIGAYLRNRAIEEAKEAERAKKANQRESLAA